MKILHINCSTRGNASESYRLSQAIVDLLHKRAPGATVIHRELGKASVSHVDEDYANALGTAQHPSETATQRGSLFTSELLIQELEGSDCIVIGTPMHNFTAPSALKAWIDHVVRVRRTFTSSPQGKIGTLPNRPVFIAISSGGIYSGKDARQPDFLTPYLTAILGTIGLHNVTFFSIQGTAAGPDAVSEGRRKANRDLAEHFSAASI